MAVNISDTLTVLTGKKPTDAEIAEITRVIHGLGAEEYNIFVKTLMFLYYQTRLINDAPTKLKATTEELIKNVKNIAIESANSEINRLCAEANKKLSEAVKDATEKSSKANGWRVHIKSIAISICLTALIMIGITYWYHNYMLEQGKIEGIEIGIAKTKNAELWLKERDSFAKTKLYEKVIEIYQDGQLENIVNMYKNKSLEEILTCSGRGWQKEIQNGKLMCFPWYYKDEKNKIFQVGWEIPR